MSRAKFNPCSPEHAHAVNILGTRTALKHSSRCEESVRSAATGPGMGTEKR